MSQVQQLSLRQLQVHERHTDGLEEDLERYEASLLAEIFRRNEREDIVQTATPPGYEYVQEDAISSMLIDAGGPIMQVAAHPGDGPDFFYATYLKMTTSTRYPNAYHEVLLTDGERGVDGWNPERTRQVRMNEAYAGAEVVGSTLHFMGYPDGSLSSLAEKMRTRLVIELADLIGDIQPYLLVVHPPQNDHPDHACSFLLTLAALELNAQAGRRIPTLLIHDVEFGLRQKCLWTPYGRGFCMPEYPLHLPGFIVDISATHQAAQRALHEHKTQMCDPITGQPKAYADLIDTLAQVRGMQFMAGGTTRIPRGQGFSFVVVPGVTSEHDILPFRLPAGSLYRRKGKGMSESDLSAS